VCVCGGGGIKTDANFYFVMLEAVMKLFILIAVHFEKEIWVVFLVSSV
jgi:hypothetical protein